MSIRADLNQPSLRAGASEISTYRHSASALLRDHDWKRSALGAPDQWPQPLKTLVELLLASEQAMFIAWGPERTFIYNDTYSEILASKHPAAFGTDFLDAWDEIRADLIPIVDKAYAGDPVHMSDIQLVMTRRGYEEETHFAFSYTPVRDEAGDIAGFFCACVEITEQVLAERRQVAERERLDRMFSQAPGFRAMLEGSEHRIVMTNPAYMKLVGHRDVLGKTVAETLQDAVEQGYLDLLDQVFASNEAFESSGAKYGVQAVPDGPVVDRYVDFIYQPLTDGQGKVTGIFVDGIDVTDRVVNERRQEFRLRFEHRLRELSSAGQIVQAAVEMLGEHLGADRVGYSEIIDNSVVRTTGSFTVEGMLPLTKDYPLEDFGPDRIESLRRGIVVVAEDVQADPGTVDPVWAAISTKGVVSVPLVRNREFVASLYVNTRAPRKWSAEDVSLIEEVANRVWDAGARAKAEAELQKFNQLLEQRVAERTAERDRTWVLSDDLLAVIGLEGSLKGINPAWARILGVDEDTLLATPFSALIHPDDKTVAGDIIVAMATGRSTQQFVNRLKTGSGDFRTISWTAVPEGDVFYAIGRDITDRQEMEEQLRQAQKMEAVGQLTGGLAHDFNNILAGIGGSLELMQSRLAQGRIGDLDRYLTGAQGAAKRAAGLTQRLLAFSRRQTLDPKPADLNLVVVGMQDLITRSVGPTIEVETVLAGGLWSAFVDVGQLESALLNLCINARDAMPDGGKLTIETANRWLDERNAKERGVVPGQYISMCVSDTGTGIDPQVMERVFDPFFTTKPIGQGTGLGLSMVHGFAGQSNGAARIYSEVGQGTMVCIYLPRHTGSAEGTHEGVEPGAAPTTAEHETILVVDDEPLVRMVAVEILEELGYQVLEAGDGPSAMKILNSDQRIDLLVTDVGLPGGMNGRQVADATRLRRPDLEILFITGYAENAVLNHGHLDHGMHVLTKPFSSDGFGRRVGELIEETRRRAK